MDILDIPVFWDPDPQYIHVRSEDNQAQLVWKISI